MDCIRPGFTLLEQIFFASPSEASKDLSLIFSPAAFPRALRSSLSLKVKMIKRRYYKIDHGDRDDASDSSSSSSDFDQEAEATEESEEQVIPTANDDNESGSTSSGYKSEDSSANDIDVNSTGQLFSEDDAEKIDGRKVTANAELFGKHHSEVSVRKSNIDGEQKCLPEDIPSHILKCKSVFKCRICPRIICLSEETLRAHLQSKRHARSQKLLSEGRLKAMLNSDGEIENLEVSETQTNTTDNPEKNSEGQKQNKKKLRKKASIGEEEEGIKRFNYNAW
ncbi:uncharacterized protein LOC129293954 isoform X2 [Prosopis cineraria]|uniref:uncharacterized protein LOC129293954 isoform X2 n=1 Tax=Prosopis cineraria TaxID=364024 RepID=UPI00241009B2|nr:uncharacterized protein LOC129293954 isoform X2 [Prosopis cineraria]